MSLRKYLTLLPGILLAASLASASGISYTCAPDVAASTCSYLNTYVAGLYSSTFTNASADIYVQYGTTGLAETNSASNYVPYATYVSSLAADGTPNSVRSSALSSLSTNAAGVYGNEDVEVSTALGTALGITGLSGVTSSGAVCSFGAAGCYDAAITVTNDPGTPLFYRNGVIASDAYDFYTTLEHETDEVLGTASCITTGTTPLFNGCVGNTPSAVDLFRYSAPGVLVPNDSLSTTPGAYFSYDGGVTNGADGNIYNTLDNGEDYADFVSNCPAGPLSVQDAEGCPGTSGLDITNDGRAEINILNAVGYNLTAASAVPEPGSITLIGASIAVLGFCRLRRRTA